MRGVARVFQCIHDLSFRFNHGAPKIFSDPIDRKMGSGYGSEEKMRGVPQLFQFIYDLTFKFNHCAPRIVSTIPDELDNSHSTKRLANKKNREWNAKVG